MQDHRESKRKMVKLKDYALNIMLLVLIKDNTLVSTLDKNPRK